jgi:ABC-type branched-subunit amino acid transport system substrate-binding protein
MSGRRWLRPVALLAVISLATAACGARVSPYFPTAVQGSGSSGGNNAGQGSSQALGSTGNVPAGGQTQPGAATQSGPTPGQPAGATQGGKSGPAQTGGSKASTAASSSALSPANFSYSPQAQASYCTGTAGNGSSAPGVTPSTITVGNVSGLSGVVANSFTPGVQAVTSVFDSVNRFGGICGRQLKLDVEDDQQSSSSDAADVQDLVPKVLAFVGDLSEADNGGVPAMVQAGAPDLGPAININRSNSPVYWSADGGSVTVRNGQAYIGNGWINGLRQYNELPKNMCVLAYNIPISAQAGQEYATLFQKEGVPVIYTNYSIPPAPGTVMGSVVSSMQQKGCQGVYTTMDIVGNADMMQDMYSDNFQPKLTATTYEGYSPDQISLAGQQAADYTKLDVFLASVPLTDQVPGVQLFQQEMQTYEPNQPLTEFGLEAWDDAELFIYALIKAGRNPTRASLTAALQGVSNWTSDGAFGPYTPSEREGPPCVTNVQVQGNGFVETWPASGLYCNQQLVDVGPSSG